MSQLKIWKKMNFNFRIYILNMCHVSKFNIDTLVLSLNAHHSLLIVNFLASLYVREWLQELSLNLMYTHPKVVHKNHGQFTLGFGSQETGSKTLPLNLSWTRYWTQAQRLVTQIKTIFTSCSQYYLTWKWVLHQRLFFFLFLLYITQIQV